MAELQNTDLLLVNRGDETYTAPGEAIYASYLDKPKINDFTLVESNPGVLPRFTDQEFVATLTMAEEGNPLSEKKFDAYVQGAILSDLSTDIITDVGELDGTWNEATAALANNWRDVAYGNGTFVAVSWDSNWRVMYSTDGINWTKTLATIGVEWEAVTFGNGQFVAIARNGTNDSNQVMYSTDGISWSNVGVTGVPVRPWESVAYGGGKFVAITGNFVNGTTDQVMYSTDGGSWTGTNSAEANGWNDVTYGDGKWVAVSSSGTNRVMYSTDDGISWSNVGVTGVETSSWSSTAFGNGTFVAVAGSGTNRVMYSTDGISWTAVAAAGNNNWTSVTYGDGKFVAVALDKTDRVMYSTDGISWTMATAQEVSRWEAVTYGGDKFVAVASSGTNQVMWSYTATGISETSLTLADSTNLDRLSVGNKVEMDSAGAPETSAITNVTVIDNASGVNVQTVGDLGQAGTPFNLFDGTVNNFGASQWYVDLPSIPFDNALGGVMIQGGTLVSSGFAGMFFRVSGTNVPTGWWALGEVGPGLTSWNNLNTGDFSWALPNGSNVFKITGPTGTGVVTKIEFVYSASGENADGSISGTPVLDTSNRVMQAAVFVNQEILLDGTALTLTNDTNLANFRVGDLVTETSGSATGTVVGIVSNSDPTKDNILTLSSPTGDWTGSTSTVTGPTFTAEAELVSVDKPINKLNVKDVTGRFLVTKPRYETDKKLNKTVIDPLVFGPPGAPTTEPPNSDYLKIVDVSGDTSNLTTYDLDEPEIKVSKAYYSRVKYNDNGITGSTISSKFSLYNEFTTKYSFLPTPGDAMEGGYYAGQINDGGTVYNLIVAPKTYVSGSGTLTGENSGVAWKPANTQGDSGSAVYGGTVTQAKANSSYPIFDWCVKSSTGPNAGTYDVSNASGTGIGGFNDWYIPAKNELAVVFFSLKPGSNPIPAGGNGSGSNPNSVLPYTPNTAYSPGFPGQTPNPLFQTGGSEAFDANARYWTATESTVQSGSANHQNFSEGQQSRGQKSNSEPARAIRRVPA